MTLLEIDSGRLGSGLSHRVDATVRHGFLAALALSLALHAGLLGPWWPQIPPPASPELRVDFVEAPVPERAPDEAMKEAAPVAGSPPSPAAPERVPASMPAPPPPSAEEWQLAATYTLKNSKRYRHAWGQQVRSMMGTAVEGPDQGMVRFRIEVAPDGRIARVEELWSTSEAASKLAWKAIRSLPPLPPTPTGKPLVFEQTISFMPYETGWPPSYKLDCLPDPPVFANPYAWDGRSPRTAGAEQPASEPSSDAGPASAECVTDSTAESIEEEEGELKRQMDQWRWGR